jgi:hypothetical protein
MAVPHLHGSGRRTRLDGSRFRPLWGGVCRRRRRQTKQSCQRHSQNAHVSALCEQASSPGENGSAQTFYPGRQAFIAGRRAAGLPLTLATLGVVRDASNLQSGPQHPLRRSLNLSGSIGTMGSGAVVIAVAWGRWCGGSPGYGAQAAADCRTDASTTPAAGDRTDDSPGAGADQAAAERTFAGIVRVCGSRRRQQQSSADHARYNRLPFHSLSTDTVQGRDLLGCRPSVKEVCPSFPSVKNTNGQGCSSVPRLRGDRRRGPAPGGHVRFVEKGLSAMLDRFQHLSVQPALHQRGARIHCRGKEPAQCYQKRWTSSIPDWALLSWKNRRRPSPARPWPLQLITTRGSEVGAAVPLEILPSPERLGHEARARFWIRPAPRHWLGRHHRCFIPSVGS